MNRQRRVRWDFGEGPRKKNHGAQPGYGGGQRISAWPVQLPDLFSMASESTFLPALPHAAGSMSPHAAVPAWGMTFVFCCPVSSRNHFSLWGGASWWSSVREQLKSRRQWYRLAFPLPSSEKGTMCFFSDLKRFYPLLLFLLSPTPSSAFALSSTPLFIQFFLPLSVLPPPVPSPTLSVCNSPSFLIMLCLPATLFRVVIKISGPGIRRSK